MRAEDLPRQKAGRRVRDGVMRVNDVEAEFARDLHDFVRKREQVLRFAEQWVGRRQDLMKGETGLKLAEPKRRFRADEMHLVTAPRQRLPELGGDDAAAPDGGVTNHSDIHDYVFSVGGGALGTCQSRSRCGRRSGSRMTNPSAKSTPASTPNCASRLS